MSEVFACGGLSKSYSRFFALRDVSLALSAGHIYGLIGNNGAGKTTLMRLIMGLCEPTSGTMALFSQTGRGMRKARQRTGALIENPIFDGGLSGRRNLALEAALKGAGGGGVVKMLEFVGLADKADQKVRYYSMGMKQRLGLAGALLGSPEFLVLDEPLNGMDPSGTRQMRGLLQGLAKERGIAILISSHQLEQLHMLATDYIFIDKGAIIRQLTGETLARACDAYVRVTTHDPVRAAADVKEELPEATVEITSAGEVLIYRYAGKPQRIAAILRNAKIPVAEVASAGVSLEDYFIDLVGGQKDDSVTA